MPDIISFPPASKAIELTSPAFSILPPIVYHADLIAGSALQAMSVAWNAGSFHERAINMHWLHDVYIAEEGLVFNNQGQLYSGSITQHESIRIETGHGKVVAAIADKSPPHPGHFVLCKKRGSGNYGHYLMEIFPRAFFARLYAGASQLRFVVPDAKGAMRNVIADSFTLLQVTSADLMPSDDSALHVENLLVIDGLTHHGVFMSPLVINAIDVLSARVRGSQHRKIYIRRPDSASRRFVNEAEVEERARANGFIVVDPGLLSLVEQISLFKNATDIVGVMGAALTNAVFAPAGARIWNLAPGSMPDTFFWFIAGLRGHVYRELRCQQEGAITGVAAWDTDLRLAPGDLDKIFGPM
jgi:capsular polysaccharide biosynthesis protein